MPEVVAVEVGRALGRQQVKGRDAHVLQPLHVPEVAAIGRCIAADVVAASAQPIQQRFEWQAARQRRLYGRDRRPQRGAASRRDGRVLLAQQALRLGTPRQDLRVEADPIRRVALPHACGAERGGQPRDQLAIGRLILEELPSRAGVASVWAAQPSSPHRAPVTSRGCVAILDPEVVVRADEADVAMGVWSGIHGAQDVARRFTGVRGTRRARVNGAEGAVWAPGGQVRVTFVFTVTHGKITAIDGVVDLERLRQLNPVILYN